MTLDEAIKEIELAASVCTEEKEGYLKAALILGTEALKREVRRRKVPYYGGYALFPGETE